MLPSISWSILANSSKWHHSSVTLKAAHSFQWWERGGGEEGWGSGGAGGEGGRNLYCYMHHTSKENQMNICLYVMFPREGLLKHEISNSFKTYDTTYQHFQGQTPALSYEPIRALQCNLFSKYHSILQKNKNTNKKQGLANHSHSLWGSYVHGTNTCNGKNPNPHVCTQIDLYTHIHVNHEN